MFSLSFLTVNQSNFIYHLIGSFRSSLDCLILVVLLTLRPHIIVKLLPDKTYLHMDRFTSVCRLFTIRFYSIIISTSLMNSTLNVTRVHEYVTLGDKQVFVDCVQGDKRNVDARRRVLNHIGLLPLFRFHFFKKRLKDISLLE